MDNTTTRKDLELSVREIHNAVEELNKSPRCQSTDSDDPIPCAFWRWFWDL